MKKCSNCKNMLICKFYDTWINKLEIINYLDDPSTFLDIVFEEIGKRCKYYAKLEDKEWNVRIAQLIKRLITARNVLLNYSQIIGCL